MCQIRYSLTPSEDRWVVRRDCRRVGDYGDPTAAAAAAMELAAIDRTRGHVVEILRLEADGRWGAVGVGNRHLCS
jgi:hypothetical protein